MKNSDTKTKKLSALVRKIIDARMTKDELSAVKAKAQELLSCRTISPQ